MWPFKGTFDEGRAERIAENERLARLKRYRERLDAVHVCNTGEYAAVGLGTVAYGVSADDAVQRHMVRNHKLHPGPGYPRPLRPLIVPLPGTGQWAAFSRGRYAEGPTPRIAAMRLLEKINEKPE